MNIRIGCSGFSYKDWKGTFYPSNIPEREMIIYYSRYFDVVELNYSFYSMPHPHTAKSFLERVPRMRFSVKANRVFTHDRSYTDREVSLFIKAIEPYVEANKLVAVLFQFPQSFHFSEDNVEYLRRLSKSFEGIDRVVEFRSRSFGRRDFLESLQELGFSLVNTDAPRIKGILVGPWLSVGDINYVRLHGRNSNRWFEHEKAYERYDYLYSEEELGEIKRRVEKIRGGKETYVFFNNHYRGKGALNALQLKEMFGQSVGSIPKGLYATHTKRLWE